MCQRVLSEAGTVKSAREARPRSMQRAAWHATALLVRHSSALDSSTWLFGARLAMAWCGGNARRSRCRASSHTTALWVGGEWMWIEAGAGQA